MSIHNFQVLWARSYPDSDWFKENKKILWRMSQRKVIVWILLRRLFVLAFRQEKERNHQTVGVLSGLTAAWYQQLTCLSVKFWMYLDMFTASKPWSTWLQLSAANGQTMRHISLWYEKWSLPFAFQQSLGMFPECHQPQTWECDLRRADKAGTTRGEWFFHRGNHPTKRFNVGKTIIFV